MATRRQNAQFVIVYAAVIVTDISFESLIELKAVYCEQFERSNRIAPLCTTDSLFPVMNLEHHIPLLF